jgi:hypothetical protein
MLYPQPQIKVISSVPKQFIKWPDPTNTTHTHLCYIWTNTQSNLGIWVMGTILNMPAIDNMD